MKGIFGLGVFRALLAVFVFSALFNTLLLVTPLYIVQLYSRILTSQSLETLLVLTVAALIAMTFAAIFDTVRHAVLQRLSHRIYVNIGERVVGISLSPALNAPNRELPLQDVEAIRRFIGGREILNLMDVPFSALFLALLFFIHPIIGAIALAMALVMLALAFVNNILSTAGQRRVADRMRQSSENFSAFAGKGVLVSSMGMARSVVHRWLESQIAFAENLRRSESQTVLMSGVSQVIRLTTQLVVLASAAYFVLQGDLNPGMMLACSILSTRAITPIEGMISGQRQFRGARDAYERIRRLLQNAPQRVQIQHSPKTGAGEASNLVYVPPGSARAQPVVRGVTFSLMAGEILAVVGPSGSGKSVLGQLLLGAIDASSGAVRIDGIDLKNCDRDTLAAAFGYLPQSADVLPGTIAENIARFGQVDGDKVWKALRLVQAEGDIGKLAQRLDTPMHRAAQELSPGTYKKLLLARAFYDMPKLVVLDEPCSDLDMEGEQMLINAMVSMQKTGTTIVVISPRGSVISHADRIMVMRGGVMESIKDRADSAPKGPLRSVGMTGVRLLAE